MPPKFKPGGRRFPPKISPSSSHPPPPQVPAGTSSASSSSSSMNVLDPEVEDQFELELCWCIQQLETSLNSGKLNEKQNLDTTRTLNVLKSNNAPLIKKRQYMRTTFGDYRMKMSNDKKKLEKHSSQVKFSNNNRNNDTHNNQQIGNKKSIFIKKAAKSSTDTSQDKTTESNNFRIIPTGDNFHEFNFNRPNTE